jgi:hypothetical protein
MKITSIVKIEEIKEYFKNYYSTIQHTDEYYNSSTFLFE